MIRELVSLIDLPPTILSCAGLEKPEQMRGRPVQELFLETANNWPRELFLQISESQVGRALRTKKWKYSVRALGKGGVQEPSSDLYTEDFLYDLDEDPWELNNLVKNPSYGEVRKTLAEVLKRRMAEAGEEIPKIHPAP